MKKTILFPAFILFLAFTACGPAAENRELMMSRSKVFQDSIANTIRVSIAESEMPGPNRQLPPAPTATAAITPTPGQQPVNPNISVATPSPKAK
jgi:hypothetical protein